MAIKYYTSIILSRANLSDQTHYSNIILYYTELCFTQYAILSGSHWKKYRGTLC